MTKQKQSEISPLISPFDYYGSKQIGFSAKIENKAEMMSRLEREKEEHKLKLKVNFLTYIFATLLLLGVSLLCFYLIVVERVETKWAETTLTVIISGFVGYLFGKNKSSSD